jgi:uncharacterized membrane protein YphA (DoxX/SURF4 family)
MKTKISNLLGHYSVQFICRVILGGLFIYASLDKIVHPHDFARIVYDYRLLPDIAIYWVAVFLPWFEMICGLLLVSGLVIRTSSILLSLMLLVFIVALGLNALRGLDVSCGCFTTSQEGTESLIISILRDIFFLVPGFIIIFFHKERMKTKKSDVK